ncbi:MAG: CRISPR-associated helicase Cas3' [Proteobacteria bacterium]|nr:CRISPR-associated helicase Cas3' [Pseudomonadota bacterium]
MHNQFDPKTSGWSKTDSEGNPGLSIFEHCRHIGWVALELVNSRKNIPHPTVKSESAALSAAIHDVGKWSPGFLQKCPVWLEQQGLEYLAIREAWNAYSACRHEKLSQDSIQLLLQKRGFPQSEAVAWAMIAGAHHGKMQSSENFGYGDLNLFIDDWHRQRHQIIEALEFELGGEFDSIDLKKTDPVIPWLMGLASVADWIGSDEKYFPVERGWDEEDGKKSAKLSVGSIGLYKPQIKENFSFDEIFGFNANDIQQKAMSVIKSPGIYIIEAPMGLGKTEAALAGAYNLLQTGQACGLYFALPTQLTSNRIHFRVSEFVGKITGNYENTRLAHANAWLEDTYYQPRPVQTLINQPNDDATSSRDWFASAKRALLANFGVGTIDQALMAMVAVKHFFVRRFALSGKVIIIDEIHSYDHFTGTLINCLCQELQKLGCTVIILSATLLPEARNKLLCVEADFIQNESYPLISGKSNIGRLIPPQTANSKPRPKVKRRFKARDELISDALSIAEKGGRVLWVCNTVNNAQETFQELTRINRKFEVGLLHSRFPYFIRQKREADWMDRLGKKSKDNNGCILVSTQIVEQSVDIDADILISELAPMDMLLQRMGRLWRHLWERPPTKRPIQNPEIWLAKEEIPLHELKKLSYHKLPKALGIKAKIYQPYVLLKTYETLDSFDSINLSDENGNSDIRKLLQLTYLNTPNDPEAWQKLACDMKGTEYAERKLAINNSRLFARPALDDEEGKQTRLIQIETIPLVIATAIRTDKVTLLNGDEISLNPEKFNIRHARSIHQNTIRVHAWPFENITTVPAVSFYLKGKSCLALSAENNQIQIKGLKEGVSLQWNDTMGIIQTYTKGGFDESCD